MKSEFRLQLKGIRIKNFKSFRDTTFEFGKGNVVVGPNASGKTNLIEVFGLLKKIYVEKEMNPFLDWWGYDNVVWKRKEELPISVELKFKGGEYEINFSTVFSGLGGKFKIVKEKIEVKGFFTIEKEGERLRIKHDNSFFEKAWAEFEKRLPHPFLNESEFRLEKKDSFLNQEVTLRTQDNNIFQCSSGGFGDYFDKYAVSFEQYDQSKPIAKFQTLLFSPNIDKSARWKTPLSQEIQYAFLPFFDQVLVLKTLKISEIKTPSRPKREARLSEDGSNVQNILYNLFLKENKFPERITSFLNYSFPDTTLKFELTTDGRILIKTFENGIELNPPSISDGFYKALTILTALESEPPLLVIDELENSLHPKTISRILDELKDSDSSFIITTHSPQVVDFTNPHDLILVEKDDEGETHGKRIEEPGKLREKLEELGITLSEGWLYGKL